MHPDEIDVVKRSVLGKSFRQIVHPFENRLHVLPGPLLNQHLHGLSARTSGFHLQGGIQAWEDRTATGPREFHLDFIKGDESPEEIILLAYRMEEGLKIFHETIKAKTGDPALSALLSSLIKAEESHEKTLLELYESLSSPAREAPPDQISEFSSDTFQSRLMEGGIDMKAFMEQNQPFLNDVSGYLDLAMMIETQALDLYLRMAADSRNELTQKILHRIGNEEKAHLELLGEYLNDNNSISR